MPKRIQRKRVKGWRLPEGAVCVTRPGKWGNPYLRGAPDIDGPRTAERCVELFRFFRAARFGVYCEASATYTIYPAVFDELRGKDLACWCDLCDRRKDGLPLGETCPDCKPCHADVLLELANA